MQREYMASRSATFGDAGSPWLVAEAPQRPPLEGDLRTDVVVVGAGLAGALVAAELVERGVNVVVLERRRVAAGTTGHSTAKITALHGTDWSTVLRSHRPSDALEVWAQRNAEAPEVVGRLVDERGIACRFRPLDAYLCERLDVTDGSLAREWQALRSLGLAVDDPEGFSDSPFGDVVSLRMEAQAQFDPGAFTLGLLASLPSRLAAVYEGSAVRSIERQGDGWVARTDGGSVRAAVVIMSSLAPARDPAMWFARAFPYAHYALLVTPPLTPRDGMWIQVSGSELTARPQDEADGAWVMSGTSARLASRADEQSLYASLASDIAAEVGESPVERFWSAEDFSTPDGLPYAGRIGPREGLYYLGGFGGWGMTKAVVCAGLVADQIEGVALPGLGSLLSPNRCPRPSAWAALVRENLHTARVFLLPRAWQRRATAALVPVVPSAGVETPRCTHLHCRTKVNTAEGTLDCPCHGSRFGSDGRPIYGPARRDARLGASLSGDAP